MTDLSVLDEIPEVTGYTVDRDARLHGVRATEVVVTLADGRTITSTYATETKPGFGGVDFQQRKDIAGLTAAKVRSVLAGKAEGA